MCSKSGSMRPARARSLDGRAARPASPIGCSAAIRDFAQVRADGDHHRGRRPTGAPDARCRPARAGRHGRPHPPDDHREVRRWSRRHRHDRRRRWRRRRTRSKRCTSRSWFRTAFSTARHADGLPRPAAYRHFGYEPPSAIDATGVVRISSDRLLRLAAIRAPIARSIPAAMYSRPITIFRRQQTGSRRCPSSRATASRLMVVDRASGHDHPPDVSRSRGAHTARRCARSQYDARAHARGSSARDVGSGAPAEVLLLRPIGEERFEALVRPGGKLGAGRTVTDRTRADRRDRASHRPPHAHRASAHCHWQSTTPSSDLATSRSRRT